MSVHAGFKFPIPVYSIGNNASVYPNEERATAAAVENAENSFNQMRWEADGSIYNQISSNTLIVTKLGTANPTPEYQFIAPQDYGSFGQPGSDGLIYKGCMSCHGSNGAYHIAAYNSRELYIGRTLGITISILASSAMATAKSSTTVFRAVDAVEESSVSNTGKFLLQEGGTEVKYFAKTLEDAHWYGPKLYPNGYTVIEGTVKGSLDVSKFWYSNVDIGAYIFPKEVLPYIIPK